MFNCTDDTRRAIETVLQIDRYEINRSYNKMEGYDDFILLSAKIAPDDLLVVVDARRGSISFTSEMDSLPDFLRHYFAANNSYGGLSGAERDATPADLATLANSMIADVSVAPSPLWIRLRGIGHDGLRPPASPIAPYYLKASGRSC